MAQVYKYDPRKVKLIVNGVPVTGFIDGTFIEVTYDPENTMNTGADGVTTVNFTPKGTALVKFSVKQLAPINSVLFKQWQQEVSVSIQNLNVQDGDSTLSGTGYIRKMPNQSYAMEETGVDWEIMLPYANNVFNV